MLKCFPIDFVRQALEQTLLEEHIKNVNYFGGKDQVAILSFYEQLKGQEEVDRFVDIYRDIVDQQNRTGLLMNGVLVAPENPSITNLYSCLIVPLTWSISFRVTLENRDQALETLNNLIHKLKGKKVDIAQLETTDDNGKKIYVPFMVGTLGQTDGEPTIKNGDFLGSLTQISNLSTLLTSIKNNGISVPNSFPQADMVYFYVQNAGKIKTIKKASGSNDFAFVTDDGSVDDMVYPPEHSAGYEAYKLSFSFDVIRCDEPRTLNSQEYCELTLSGSATLVSKGVQLGNDLIKVGITKYGIKAQNDITFANPTTYYLEPLEMPSGNNANTQINQLVSNKFVSMSHTDSIALTQQYTFIFDKNIDLLKQLFNYGRYGTQGTTASDISPNMIFITRELWSSWGEVEKHDIYTKIVESVDIENTESDALTIGITMQMQGEVS